MTPEVLKVPRVDKETLLRDYIIPKLPTKVGTDSAVYLSLITAISHICQQYPRNCEGIKIMLRKSKSACNGVGVLHYPCQLFDHEDIIFMAAFRNKPERFLLKDTQNDREFWASVGLSQRKAGKISTDDYVLCLRTMQMRLETAVSLFSSPQLISDAEIVLGPLTQDSYVLVDFKEADWATVGNEAVFLARTIFEDHPVYRRETMAAIVTTTATLRLSNAIQEQYIPVCWSQTPFPKNAPQPWTFSKIPSAGKPPINMVWKHLEHLRSTVGNLGQEAVSDFLADVYATYTYLQSSLEDSDQSLWPYGSAVWLNLETEANSVSLGELKSSWSSIDYLVLSSPCDYPPIMRIKNSLMPYEMLLRRLGCQQVIRPNIEPPDAGPSRSISSSLARLRREEKMLDITFIVEGKEVRAHKVVMAAASEFFQTQFNGNWPSNNRIPLEFSHKTLSVVIDFAYTDVFDWTSMQVAQQEQSNEEIIADKRDVLLDILDAANYFLMSDLKSQVEDQIRCSRDFMRIDDVLDMRKRALEARADKLLAACDAFLNTGNNRKLANLCAAYKENP